MRAPQITLPKSSPTSPFPFGATLVGSFFCHQLKNVRQNWNINYTHKNKTEQQKTTLIIGPNTCTKTPARKSVLFRFKKWICIETSAIRKPCLSPSKNTHPHTTRIYRIGFVPGVLVQLIAKFRDRSGWIIIRINALLLRNAAECVGK